MGMVQMIENYDEFTKTPWKLLTDNLVTNRVQYSNSSQKVKYILDLK